MLGLALFLKFLGDSQAALCPELCQALDGNYYPCRYHRNNCVVNVSESGAKEELHVVMLGPYSGPQGNGMSTFEPMLRLAAQQIEDSSTFLPGYRLKIHLVETACNAKVATRAIIESLSTPPAKHIVVGPACSDAAQAVNDAVQYFNVLQISPTARSDALSDRQRYPYFTRMTPSFRFNIVALVQLTKVLNFQRVGIICGFREISLFAYQFLMSLIQMDLQAGAYPWTVLLHKTVSDEASAGAALQEMQDRDAKINFLALYEDEDGAMLLCQAYRRNMVAPEYVWLLVSGWWYAGFMSFLAGSEKCPCTAQELQVAAHAMIGADAAGTMDTSDLHGLSGQELSGIVREYLAECRSSDFANGLGPCSLEMAGYVYDAVWHAAALLDAFLANRSAVELGTAATQAALYEMSLKMDYTGLTGRVRQFNAIDPVTYPPSHGDREGYLTMRQWTGPVNDAHRTLCFWTAGVFHWEADIVWSTRNANHTVACSSGTCDMANAFLPADRSSQCPAGYVWSLQLGCVACSQGTFEQDGVCEMCAMGSFGNQTGLDSCFECEPGTCGKAEGARFCKDCAPGSAVASFGATECIACPKGRYTQEEGLGQCRECPSGRSTNFEGANSESACICTGHLWQGSCVHCSDGYRFQQGSCVWCMEGLHCEEGEQPIIRKGFYADTTSPFEMYKCLPADYCPGGSAGNCTGGRVGLPCSGCEEGKSWDGQSCQPCSGLGSGGWFLGLAMGMVCLFLSYYLLNSTATAKASTLLATTCVLAMTITMLQSVGIVGLISFQWPSELQWIFNLTSFVLLDLDSMGFDCFSSSPSTRYVINCLALPAAMLWILLCGVLSQMLPHRFRFQPAKMLSTMGQVCQVTFTIVSKIALTPMMCYRHPNGQMGLLKYNGILCFESGEHAVMFALGVALLCLLSAFLAACLLLAWRAPLMAQRSKAHVLQSMRFLIGRFREDHWWFGAALLPRGLLLSLAIALATDHPYIQMILIALVVLCYLIVQLVTWPWKLPALNFFDAAIGAALAARTAKDELKPEAQGSNQSTVGV
ncbi:unnamed protein product [Effrenium voratum]|nr:unnamed protein product [Effrenium voratum]